MAKDKREAAVLYPQHSSKQERAVLVGMQLPRQTRDSVSDSLAELQQLTETAGAIVCHVVTTKREAPTPAYYIGKGKAEEIADLCQTDNINLVILDDDLTPAQGKNLQDLFAVKVIDRTELILDIFAQHAHSRAGKIQIELAQLQYMLPRLVHAWKHLSRQWGGIGCRGPGERQLELDRRRVREQITKLGVDLKKVHDHRYLQRKRRERVGIPLVALIGYTNAGKSTLFNKLTQADIPVEDKLFTTLDPTIRKLILPNKQTVLFSDTVGFIRKLPHHLVAAFKSTLEEVREADLLLHVIDGSARQIEQQYSVVMSLVKELDVFDKPLITVINKKDLIDNHEKLCRKFPQTTTISARYGDGVTALIEMVQLQLSKLWQCVRLMIPNKSLGMIAKIHSLGKVVEVAYSDKGAQVTAELAPSNLGSFKRWLVDE